MTSHMQTQMTRVQKEDYNLWVKAPYDNADFRWGIALALNIDEISMNTFSGAGRAAPILL